MEAEDPSCKDETESGISSTEVSWFEEPRHAIKTIDKKEVPANLKVRSSSVTKLPQVQNLQPSQEKLKDLNYVLRDPLLCAGFRRYLQMTFAEENLDFWKQVEIFRKCKPKKRKR